MIDTELLERHRTRVDPEAGIREELLRARIGGAATVAVLTEPLEGSPSAGWVLCPSFGSEAGLLWRLEAGVARRLASAGFAVLRYHGQGYGDSELAGDLAPTPGSHLADAADAVTRLRELRGIRHVVAAGALLGGTVAALTADRLDLPGFVAWQPATDGAAYVRALLRGAVLSGIAPGGVRTSERELRGRLRSEGFVDLGGFRLTAEAGAELSRIDLARDLSRFDGEVLLVPVIGPGAPGALPRPQAELRRRLDALGARCTLSPLVHEAAPLLGRPAYRRGVDRSAGLIAALVDRTARWAARTGDRP